VAINYRQSLQLAENLRDEIRRDGGDCEAFHGDVSSPTEARKLIQDVLGCFHHIDVLVNNAGITRDHSIRKMTDREWLEVIETNLNSAFYCISAVVPAMIEQKYGRIVNIASFCGQTGNFGQVNYSASKGGIIAMTKALALELAKYNITVNAIAPGFTSTDMLAAVPGEILDHLKDRIPLHRFAEPEEIAKAVAFVICDGDYITGQQINVNGGIYM
jgi:acetoacetyl-CoA reductase/3-oxoacyl-[acyl-carrier protein] reductase